MLTIQFDAHHLILDPIARDVVGALGRVDLCTFPSYENLIIALTKDGWRFIIDPPTLDRPWSQEAFLALAKELAARA